MSSPGFSSRWVEYGAVLVILSVQLVLLVSGLFASSPTCDEPNHLAAGLAALNTGDFRFNRDHPPLQNLVCALPAEIFYNPRLDFDNQAWERAIHLGLFSRKMLLANPDHFEHLFFAARFGTVLLTLGLSVALFFVARSLSGFLPACVTLTLFAVEPNILAHGRLVTTDLSAALFFFLSTWAFCRFLERNDEQSAALLGLTLGAGLLSKHSVFVVVPAFALTWILYNGPAIWNRFASREKEANRERNIDGKRTVGNLLICFAVSILVIWAGFGFEIGDPVAEERPPHWSPAWQFAQSVVFPVKFFLGMTTGALSDSTNPSDPVWVAMREWLPMFNYFDGFFFQLHHARGFHEGYLMGETRVYGWWYYYPINSLIKTPVALVPAGLFGLIVWWRMGDLRRSAQLAYIVPPLFYFVSICLLNRANIGWRHALPVIPFLCLWAGGTVKWLSQRGNQESKSVVPKMYAGVIGTACFLSVLPYYPDTIPYLNFAARRIAPPTYWVADSNLDWGQDVRQLKEFIDENDIDSLYLLHFGAPELLELYGIPAEVPGRDEMDKPAIYAISSSVMCGLGSFKIVDRFQTREPDYVVGNTLFIYDFRSTTEKDKTDTGKCIPKT